MTLLSTLMPSAALPSLATTAVAGTAPLATLAEVQAGTDNQKIATALDLGTSYLGYHIAGRNYPAGSIVLKSGTFYTNTSGAPTATTPPGLAWGPTYTSIPPLAANTVLSPAASSGLGTLASPYIVTTGSIPSGSSNLLITTVTISNMTPGAFCEIYDANAAANGSRFAFSNRLVNGQGNLVFNVLINDNPASAVATVYTLALRVGRASVYIQFVGTVTAGVPAVQTPSITSPGALATGFSQTGPIVASSFLMTSGVDTHANSDWQIALDAGFSAIVFSSLADALNKTSIAVSPSLAAGTQHFARVRYRTAGGILSAYSAVTSFTTTTGAVGIVTPTITAPTTGSTGQSNTALSVVASGFTLSSGIDTHLNTDWQIATDAGFTSIAVQSMADAANKTTWTATGLSQSTTYYMRCRYRSTTGVVSGYSTTVSFTTATPFGFNWGFYLAAGIPNTVTGVNHLTYGNNKLVAVYTAVDNIYVYSSSDDGATFTLSSTLVAPSNAGNYVYFTSHPVWCAAQNQWVIVTNENVSPGVNIRMYTSPDLVTWTLRYTNTNSVYTQHSLSYANGILFATCYNTAISGCALYRSSDGGVTWTVISLVSVLGTGSTAAKFYSVTYNPTLGGGTYVAACGVGNVGGNNNFIKSTDGGLTWSVVAPMVVTGPDAATSITGQWPDLAYNNGVYATSVANIGGSDTGLLVAWRTTDLVNWTVIYPFGSVISIPVVGTIVGAGNGLFVAGHQYSQGAFTSVDGLSWTYRPATVIISGQTNRLVVISYLTNITFSPTKVYLGAMVGAVGHSILKGS